MWKMMSSEKGQNCFFHFCNFQFWHNQIWWCLKKIGFLSHLMLKKSTDRLDAQTQKQTQGQLADWQPNHEEILWRKKKQHTFQNIFCLALASSQQLVRPLVMCRVPHSLLQNVTSQSECHFQELGTPPPAHNSQKRIFSMSFSSVMHCH